MDPFTLMMLISSGVSAVGQIQAGQAAAGTAEQNAEQMVLDRELRGIQSKQDAAARMESLAAAQSANDAFFAFSGRDPSGMSVKAFTKKQDEIAMTEIGRGQAQAKLEMSRLSMQAAAEKARGRNAMRAAGINAFTTLASGLYQYSQVRTPSSTPTRISGNIGGASRPIARSSGRY